MNKLNALHRKDQLAQAVTEKYDLLVVGGGITGAGIALDAASRGLKTLLIEMQDFAAGTSSRSTKLVHGGLRYLKQLEFSLVREVGKERAIVYRNAPHIVVPEKMLMPLIEGGNYGQTATSFGLWLYDRLAGVTTREQRKMLRRSKTLETEPLLRQEGLLGGGLYWEYRTDDGRLTIETLKTAAEHGALVLNYLKATTPLYEAGKMKGIQAEDLLNGHSYEIRASHVVNAAGPWVDELRAGDGSLKGKRLHHTKGIHLVVPYKRLPLRQITYFDVSDKRMIFAIPRGKTTYIGTTDTDYKGDLEHPGVTMDDVDYLLKAVNQMFPGTYLVKEDVVSSWAGIRPLIHEEGKSPSELSRKDELFISDSGMISIAGGKLTGYRKMAQRAVDEVMRSRKKEGLGSFKGCMTSRITLSGGNLKGRKGVAKLAEKLFMRTNSLLKAETITQLVDKYGSNAEEILDNAMISATWLDDPSEALLEAELIYSVHNEGIQKPGDFFIRRTGMLYFERERIPGFLPLVMHNMGAILGWGENQSRRLGNEFLQEYEAVLRFK